MPTPSWLKATIMLVMFAMLGSLLWKNGNSAIGIGFAFWQVCAVSTIVAVGMGFWWRSRSWCTICPMATIQQGIIEAAKAKQALKNIE